MLKKYMYVGVLLGAIVLAGCSINEESEEQVQVKEGIMEDITNGQAVEVETLPDTEKEEVVSVTPLELTQEQKVDYHKQYTEILEQVNAEYPIRQLELVPLNEFEEEGWVEPEEFRHSQSKGQLWNLPLKLLVVILLNKRNRNKSNKLINLNRINN